MRKITALLLRMSAVIIALANFSFAAGVAPTLMMSSRQNMENYVHLFLGPGLLILVCLIVAFNADAIARFICRDDEDLSFGHVSGHDLARVGVSLLALFIIIYAIAGFARSTTNFMLIGDLSAEDLTLQIRSAAYVGASVRFVIEVIFGSYLLLKTNRVATFIAKREPQPSSSE